MSNSTGSQTPRPSVVSLSSIDTKHSIPSIPDNTSRNNSKSKPWLNKFKFRKDYRADLPPIISRFIGYRPIYQSAPYEPIPIPPFTWLKKIPLHVETWIFAWIGSFTSILLIEAIMSTNTAFRDVIHAPLIITSFGAAAVLLFGAIESPLVQPRNMILGHFISAVLSVAISRLFVKIPSYQADLQDGTNFHATSFVNGGLVVSTALVAMLITGTAHPPAGATALNAAVQPQVVAMSWQYVAVIMASDFIVFGWALFINNLGRRRYPMHWWSPDQCFVYNPDAEEEAKIEAMEKAELERERTEEGSLRRESMDSSDTERYLDRMGPSTGGIQ